MVRDRAGSYLSSLHFLRIVLFAALSNICGCYTAGEGAQQAALPVSSPSGLSKPPHSASTATGALGSDDPGDDLELALDDVSTSDVDSADLLGDLDLEDDPELQAYIDDALKLEAHDGRGSGGGSSNGGDSALDDDDDEDLDQYLKELDEEENGKGQ